MPRRKPTGGKPATRSSRTKLLDDPDQRERELNAQLKSMSLYASQTSGDGNCLFRALSDQFYGRPDHHARLRQEICDYLAASPDRYAGFVDIEKPFDEYVGTMRQNGTYGGHLELSAFASLKKKEIKIVQPGLVYVVSGDDDSRDAMAERQALEEERQRIQDSLPPGAEGPPLTNRDVRRRKRMLEQRASREPSSSRDESEDRARSGSVGESSSGPLTKGPAEAFGPLYIAYHNWEHYSSVRNVEGPHTGLPRIIERNVSLANESSSSTKGKARFSDDDDEAFVKPTEHEELILRSVPGHTLSEVRFLLKQHGNLWESVVEVLIAQDAAGDTGSSGSVGLGTSPPGALTRSRAPSNSYSASPRLSQQRATTINNNSSSSTQSPHLPPASSDHSYKQLPSAVPEHLRGARNAWRGVSPSASSSGGDAGSGSGHGTASTASGEDALSTMTGQTDSTGATILNDTKDEDDRGAPRTAMMSGIKRAASKDLVPLDGDERSPKRRSSSRERERDEKLVDGALASQFESAASTRQPGEESDDLTMASSQTTAMAGNASEGVNGVASDDGRVSKSRSGPLNLDDDDLALYYSNSRRTLSPPLSSDDIASLRAEVSSMSSKDKREWDLKRKRDRQRERRALAQRQKEMKSGKAGSQSTTSTKDVTKSEKKAARAERAAAASSSASRLRREHRSRQDINIGDESKVVPKGGGFVELKI